MMYSRKAVTTLSVTKTTVVALKTVFFLRLYFEQQSYVLVLVRMHLSGERK